MTDAAMSQWDQETGTIQSMVDAFEQQPKVVTYQDLLDDHHQAMLDAIHHEGA